MPAPKGNKYAAGHGRGAPTKYDPKYAKAMERFFARDSYETREITIRRKDGSTDTKYEDVACEFPTLAEFALSIGVHRDTLHEWAREHEDFSDAYQKAKAHQERILVSNAIKDRYAQPFAIFAAKNILKWTDKIETVNSHSFEELPDEELNAKILELVQKVGSATTKVPQISAK